MLNVIKVLIKKGYNFPRKCRFHFYVHFNRLYFKACGAHIGKNFKIFNSVYLFMYDRSYLSIGDNFLLQGGEGFNILSRNIKAGLKINKGASLIIGDNVGISSTCIWALKSIIIGNNVKIGADCILLDSDCHRLNYLDRRSENDDRVNKKDKEIVIEDDVLIGARCIILKGVHIGARSVIGAGSVVAKDIPSDCIAAGNPCKVIKRLD